jgi:hypothetical protein
VLAATLAAVFGVALVGFAVAEDYPGALRHHNRTVPGFGETDTLARFLGNA